MYCLIGLNQCLFVLINLAYDVINSNRNLKCKWYPSLISCQATNTNYSLVYICMNQCLFVLVKLVYDVISSNRNLSANCLQTVQYLGFEPVHEISNNVVCATSKASDQPAHTRSLIRALASRLSIL